jgi:deazaflavin-dependent oxidoreductase (nitroreductase family)
MTTESGSRKPEWVLDHIKQYQETGGKDGHIWRDVTTLLLTTTGRQSGSPDTTPLIYGKSGDDYIIVASRGGAPRHPNWYLNLRAEPEVGVQVQGDRFTAQARTATAEEKSALWSIMTQIWPAYDEYQTRTTREIPVIVLERQGGSQ